MATITHAGKPVHTVGNLPAVGQAAPPFTLTNTDLEDVSLADFAGLRVVLNIFPSIDTGICAASTRRFNQEAETLDDTVVLCVSLDLPFAHERFCAAEGLDDVIPLSAFRQPAFGDVYGVRLTDGTLAGLFSRAVVVIDEGGKVLHAQQVPEIKQEPDYAAVLACLA